MAQNQCKRIKKNSSLITSCFDVLLCAIHGFGQLHKVLQFWSIVLTHQPYVSHTRTSS